MPNTLGCSHTMLREEMLVKCVCFRSATVTVKANYLQQKIRWTTQKCAKRKQLANDVPGLRSAHNGQRLRGDDNFIITLFNDHYIFPNQHRLVRLTKNRKPIYKISGKNYM